MSTELRKLKFSYIFGPENILSSISINSVDAIVIPLSSLFNKSIKCGNLPNIWKDSFIIPLFKSGNKSEKKNYRGIAKLGIIEKLFEEMIFDDLCYQVSNIKSPYQHGFRKKCSTIKNLLYLSTVVYWGVFHQQLAD